jgi:hypothetical protein
MKSKLLGLMATTIFLASVGRAAPLDWTIDATFISNGGDETQGVEVTIIGGFNFDADQPLGPGGFPIAVSNVCMYASTAAGCTASGYLTSFTSGPVGGHNTNPGPIWVFDDNSDLLTRMLLYPTVPLSDAGGVINLASSSWIGASTDPGYFSLVSGTLTAPTSQAPEIDPSAAAGGLTLIIGSLLVLLRGRRLASPGTR